MTGCASAARRSRRLGRGGHGAAGCGAGTRPAATASGCDANFTLSRARATAVVDGRRATRVYTVHVPATMTTQTPTPLILAFAGYRMRPGSSSSSATSTAAARSSSTRRRRAPRRASAGRGAVLVGANDVAFTTALLDDVESRLCIDPKRVFAAGISNGGGFVSLLSCASPNASPRSPWSRVPMYPATNPSCESAPRPRIEFHGTADDVIPYDGGIRTTRTVAPVVAGCRRWRSATAAPSIRARNGRHGGREAELDRMPRPCGALVHYRIDGEARVAGARGLGGHVDATTLIETFFTAHPLP